MHTNSTVSVACPHARLIQTYLIFSGDARPYRYRDATPRRFLDCVLEAAYASEPPEWVRAGAWVSKAALGLVNAGVWSAPFVRTRAAASPEGSEGLLVTGSVGSRGGVAAVEA
jgi:hypothetical protein